MSTAIQTCVSEGKVWMECQLLPKLVYQKARFVWNINCYPNLCIRRQGLYGMSTAIQTVYQKANVWMECQLLSKLV